MVAGARLVADPERLPVVLARRFYAGVRHGARRITRVRLTT